LGGKLALDLSGAHPERVTKLAVLAPPIAGWRWTGEFRDYVVAENKALEADDLDTAMRVNLDMWVRGPARDWSPPLEALAATLTEPMRISLVNQAATEDQELDDGYPAVEEALAELRMPVLVGIGDKDVPDFISISEHLAAAIPGAELVRFPGAGHLLPAEVPGEVAAVLRRFLTS
jgi:3-oxoadipate enol-lactonase